MGSKINEFAKIRELVESALLRYREVRKDCGIPDTGWHSRTIENMAAPFIKGYFTLAVVGKVSSGKSTFINALLGCKDLLPTGHDQTTCGITYIEYGEQPEVKIKFGDKSEKVIKEDIGGVIRLLVAIPQEYHNLPVNHIDGMILGGYDFEKIWEVHQTLENETNCSPIEKKLLKEYVEHRKISNIAVEVRIKYPFNEELKGWRIIDTPGIGAIGGIEVRTKQLLATQKADGSREVDAIIFLQDGSQTLDQSDTKDFMKEQLENFTDADKNRLFYVLTHSGSLDFVTHKESKIDFIKKNYGSKIKVLTYVDSLLHAFLTDPECSNLSLDEYKKFGNPSSFSETEWEAIMLMLFQAERHINKLYDSVNHDTMLRTIQEWAHFEELKNEINTFAKNEKHKTLVNLLNLIEKDYRGFIKQFKRDKKFVDGNIDFINNEIEHVNRKRTEYNRLSQKADNLIKIDNINAEFNFIEKELESIDTLTSINGVRTSVTNLFDAVQKKEKEVFDNIIKQFSDFFSNFDSDDIVLGSIDFRAIENEATLKSKESYVIEPEQVKKHTSKPDERIPAKYGTRTNQETKLRNFKALTLRSVRRQRDLLLHQIREKVKNMKDQIYDELDKKIKDELVHYESLKAQLTGKEELKRKNDLVIAKSHEASKNLIKLAEEYGVQF